MSEFQPNLFSQQQQMDSPQQIPHSFQSNMNFQNMGMIKQMSQNQNSNQSPLFQFQQQQQIFNPNSILNLNNSNKSLSKYKNRKSEPFPDLPKKFEKNESYKDSNLEEDEKKEDEVNEDNDNEEGFSILGMIERVSKERKRTKSVVIK